MKLIILVNRNLSAVYGALSKDNDSVIEQEDSLFILSFLHHAAIVAIRNLFILILSKLTAKKPPNCKKRIENKCNHKLDMIITKI